MDGWFQLHEKFGRLPMADLLAPAIRCAREGFPVTEVIAARWRRDGAWLSQWPGFAETFMPGGRAPQKGEIFQNPSLATTLEKIARGGRDAFYRGEIARTIDAYMKRVGGFLSYEDLAEHRSERVQPVSSDYRGYTVWELPPNGQGIAVLQMLNIPLRWLISKEYAAQRRALIDRGRAARRYDPGAPTRETGETIYLTVADRDGNMVSLIQSNYAGFGSGRL